MYYTQAEPPYAVPKDIEEKGAAATRYRFFRHR